MEKKGLGRGLGALIPNGDNNVERSTVNEIDIERITKNPYQPRKSFNDEKFRELVESVRVHGVLQPVVVRTSGSGQYELVAGERRLRASVAAGLKRVPAVIRELTDEQSLQVALIENLQREDINAMEAAQAYKRLADEFGLSQEELALSIGKSRSSVANTVRLLNLPEVIQRELSGGAISEGHARAILSLGETEDQVELCKRIVAAGLSVRDTERMARDWQNQVGSDIGRANVSRETIPAKQDPNVLEVESRLREVLGTKVNLVKNKDRGRIEIEFYSDDELERLLYLLTGG